MMETSEQLHASPVLSMDRELIQRILPHRYPMQHVDAVEACRVTEGHIVASRAVCAEEAAVRGYRKGRDVFPPVLVIEALAQTSGLLMSLDYLMRERHLPPERLLSPEALAAQAEAPQGVLAETRIHQHRFARPGEQIRLESRLRMRRLPMYLFQVRASAGEHLLAEGEILLSFHFGL
jgi:3-hydroxymyristoyl/3-hydroxydecanoyl-(acyl carrier protein) dehydratase